MCDAGNSVTTKEGHLLLLFLLPNVFRGMGARRKTMKPQKQGNSPRPEPQVVERQRVAPASGAGSVVGPCRMR